MGECSLNLSSSVNRAKATVNRMLVDPHVHTSIGSPDSNITPQELIVKAKRRGIEGLCLTDHNSYAGFKEAQQIGQKEGVLVIRGIELDTRRGHVLVYGADMSEFLEVNKAILRERIESRRKMRVEDLREIFFSVVPSFEVDKLVDVVHAKSGAVVLPHPFGQQYPSHMTMRYYLDHYLAEMSFKHGNEARSTKIEIEQLVTFVQSQDPILFAVLKEVDGIEVLNPSCSWVENQAAFTLADYLGKNKIGGSDAHAPEEVGLCVTVFPSNSNIRCERDLVHHLTGSGDLQPRINLVQDKVGYLGARPK